MDILDSIVTFFNQVVDFLSSGLYAFVTKAFAEAIKWFILATLNFKIMFARFAWDVAKELLLSFNVSQVLQAAWSSLDSRVLSFCTFLRIPDALNLVLSAHTTRFVMRMVGF